MIDQPESERVFYERDQYLIDGRINTSKMPDIVSG